MEFILIWLIFSPLVGVYAHKRGRSGILAFLVAVILSPLLAFLIYAILGETRKAKENRILEEERLRAEIQRRLSS